MIFRKKISSVCYGINIKIARRGEGRGGVRALVDAFDYIVLKKLFAFNIYIYIY